ncbi:hypothetical protein [Streptomyces sp. WAC08241]|uniref:hypothetical protein n=1 Tax=Streptomyces sp. WAC08241 TaxID=2487421 RepID=UPI00163CD496|nr:hypothetical protein [Streptomyces sp. WAC08241]
MPCPARTNAARPCVQTMQRRVFDSTETFVRDHNVDIAAYRQRSTVICDFGVMNGGTWKSRAVGAPAWTAPRATST